MSNSLAICDTESFDLLRRLVEGPIDQPSQLIRIEELVRAVVLHDDIAVQLGPHWYDPDDDREWSLEENVNGGRIYSAAFGPAIESFGLFASKYGPIPDVSLSTNLIDLAGDLSRELAASEFPDNSIEEVDRGIFRSHVSYLKRLFGVHQKGGSVICTGPVGIRASASASEYPAKLFECLDKDWRDFAQLVHNGSLGLVIPPILTLVLNRTPERSAIPRVLKNLREELAAPRRKVWELLSRLKYSSFKEAVELRNELADASQYFSPNTKALSISPLQFIWSLFVEGAKGAATAGISGGNLGVGAAAQATGHVFKVLQSESNFARVLFGRGGFGLARRIRRELSPLQTMPSQLGVLLSNSERAALGI
jgi:hypothetical protein